MSLPLVAVPGWTLGQGPGPVGSFNFQTAPPPVKPPGLLQTGSYCMRATVHVTDPAGEVAKIVGYDKNPDIGKNTERTCRMHVKNVPGWSSCSEASVVLIPNSSMECSGQYYLNTGDAIHKL